MRKLAALLAVPLVAMAQEGTPPPAEAPAQPPQYAPPPAQPAPASPPPAQPPQYAPPPQYVPPPPQYTPPPPGTPPPPQPYQPPQRQRGPWYIGFGLGGGDGSLELSDGTADFKDLVYPGRTTVAFNFRVGATMSPRLLLGFDGGFVSASSDSDGYNSSVQLNYYDVGVMFFPMERGFYLRGGLGLSSVVQEVESPFTPFDYSARGFNVLGGIGYAFWLGRSFNLTLNLDAQRHTFNEDNVESGTSWSAWVGFDWY
jgi:hypothetical protein